jgi:prepilin signal peptidase PulO-like enzyme (type II secretory pathway)
MCASLIGSVVGLAMVVLKRPAKDLPEEVEGQGGHYLPFGPYLALAGIVLILFGREIFDFYHGFIGSAAMLP